MSSSLTKLSSPLAILTVTDKIAHEFTKDTIVYVATSKYVGHPKAQHISSIKTCDIIVNKFPLMEMAHINYKRKFIRMNTAMNGFIATCRQMKKDNVKLKKHKLFILSFYFYKKGLGKLKGQ
jgi:hypothetical protein